MNLVNFLILIILFITLKTIILVKDGHSVLDNLINMENMNILLILMIICVLYNQILKKFEEFENIENFAPVDYTMGDFSNLLLKPDGCSDWRKPPACNKLQSNIFVPQGTQVPLKTRISEPIKEGPPVDGNSKDDNRKDMFIFAYNKSSPDCCPSTYSTSTGCICTTKNQRDYINQRGNNRTETEINKKLMKNAKKYLIGPTYIDA